MNDAAAMNDGAALTRGPIRKNGSLASAGQMQIKMVFAAVHESAYGT